MSQFSTYGTQTVISNIHSPASAFEFLRVHRDVAPPEYTAISLFSSGGLSDLGYELAGFAFVVQAERNPSRVELCRRNFPRSKNIVGDLEANETIVKVISAYEAQTNERPALLSVTPPCQGMSSNNPQRGKIAVPDDKERGSRNLLLLASIPVIRELRPRVVVVENVPQALLRQARLEQNGPTRRLVEFFGDDLEGYHLFPNVIQMADYGVPQNRRRFILVAVHEDEPWLPALLENQLLPLPRPMYTEKPTNGTRKRWLQLDDWLKRCNYPPLDAGFEKTSRDLSDPLHFVNHYEGDVRYTWIEDIPPNSGRSAYQNANCRSCGFGQVPEGDVYCPNCGEPMRNRPHVVKEDGTYRLITGFVTSYRRMLPDQPAPTVTTASSHFGSSYTVHPWENRLMSIRECADLQTVPRFYDWSWALGNKQVYQTRQIIGEALPPWFTYLHGQVLAKLLRGEFDQDDLAIQGDTKTREETFALTPPGSLIP